MKVHSTIMRIQMDFIWIRIRLTRKNNGRIRPQEQKLDPDQTNAKNTDQDQPGSRSRYFPATKKVNIIDIITSSKDIMLDNNNNIFFSLYIS